MKTEAIFKKMRSLNAVDLEGVAAKYVLTVLFKVLISRGSIAPLSGPALKSGKKYDIYLSDDMEEDPAEQVEVFAHELLHIWLCHEGKLEHRDQYEDEVSAAARTLIQKYSDELQTLLGKYLIK